MPLTACSMFTRSFVLQTGIWLISELVVHARIPVTIPFRLPLYLPFFLPPPPSSVSTSASVFCPPVFPFAHSLALCRTRNAIYRAEFIERVRAFTHANMFLYVRSEITSRLRMARDCENDFTLRDLTFN